jgi:hypothetical protein
LTMRGHLTTGGYGSALFFPDSRTGWRLNGADSTVHGIGATRALKNNDQGQDMSTSVELQGFQSAVAPHAAKPPDEAVWKAWVAKGRASERRHSARRFTVVKLVSIVVLLTTAAVWSNLAPLDIVVRFIVAVCAAAVMLQTFRARNYAFAAVFGALALLYNPLVSVFSFAGDWQRFVTAASVIPFLIALAWRDVGQADPISGGYHV